MALLALAHLGTPEYRRRPTPPARFHARGYVTRVPGVGVREALRQLVPPLPELVDGLNEHVLPHADNWRQFGVFPPAIEPTIDADVETRLLYTLGTWSPRRAGRKDARLVDVANHGRRRVFTQLVLRTHKFVAR